MKIFFISPHPDDIEFGCGGIIQKSCIAKHNLYCFVNTYCANKNDIFFNDTRKNESMLLEKDSCKVLFWSYEDVEEMIEYICEIKPDVIILPYKEDTNETHRSVHRNMRLAIERSKIGNGEIDGYYTPCVLYYETFSSIHFIPDIVVDTTEVYGKALNQLRLHRLGIKALPSLPYVFQVKHQFHGITGECLYGEGLLIDKTDNRMWSCNLRLLLKYLQSII